MTAEELIRNWQEIIQTARRQGRENMARVGSEIIARVEAAELDERDLVKDDDRS